MLLLREIILPAVTERSAENDCGGK